MKLPDQQTRCDICIAIWVIVLTIGAIIGIGWTVDTLCDQYHDAHEWRAYQKEKAECEKSGKHR